MNENEILEPTTENDTQMYIDAINDLKKNSVNRQEYDRIRDENKKLLESLVNGKSIETASTEETAKPDVKELRENLFKEQTNLSYWENVLALREAIISSGAQDPFLPFGQKIAPTEEDVIKAQKVADVIGECIEYAEGDPAVFTNELQRRTIDVGPGRRK